MPDIAESLRHQLLLDVEGLPIGGLGGLVFLLQHEQEAQVAVLPGQLAPVHDHSGVFRGQLLAQRDGPRERRLGLVHLARFRVDNPPAVEAVCEVALTPLHVRELPQLPLLHPDRLGVDVVGLRELALLAQELSERGPQAGQVLLMRVDIARVGHQLLLPVERDAIHFGRLGEILATFQQKREVPVVLGQLRAVLEVFREFIGQRPA